MVSPRHTVRPLRLPKVAHRNDSTNVTASLSGLTQNTTYHFRVVAANVNGRPMVRLDFTTGVWQSPCIHDEAHNPVTNAPLEQVCTPKPLLPIAVRLTPGDLAGIYPI